MEIVINSCPGEFSLSEEAVKQYAHNSGLVLYIRREPCENLYYTKKKELRKDEEDGLWIPKKHIPRSEKTLVDIVKTMGKKANTIYSSLHVASVDNSRKWLIVENDGKETIQYLD